MEVRRTINRKCDRVRDRTELGKSVRVDRGTKTKIRKRKESRRPEESGRSRDGERRGGRNEQTIGCGTEDMQSSELNSFLRRLTRSLNVPDRSARCYTYYCGFRTSVLRRIINHSTGVPPASLAKQLHLLVETRLFESRISARLIFKKKNLQTNRTRSKGQRSTDQVKEKKVTSRTDRFDLSVTSTRRNCVSRKLLETFEEIKSLIKVRRFLLLFSPLYSPVPPISIRKNSDATKAIQHAVWWIDAFNLLEILFERVSKIRSMFELERLLRESSSDFNRTFPRISLWTFLCAEKDKNARNTDSRLPK